jgi:hypothetical protein
MYHFGWGNISQRMKLSKAIMKISNFAFHKVLIFNDEESVVSLLPSS